MSWVGESLQMTPTTDIVTKSWVQSKAVESHVTTSYNTQDYVFHCAGGTPLLFPNVFYISILCHMLFVYFFSFIKNSLNGL